MGVEDTNDVDESKNCEVEKKSEIEGEVHLEGELICSLKEIRKFKKKNQSLK